MQNHLLQEIGKIIKGVKVIPTSSSYFILSSKEAKRDLLGSTCWNTRKSETQCVS